VRRSPAAVGALVVALASAGCGTSDAPGTDNGGPRTTIDIVEPTAASTVAPTDATTVATSGAGTTVSTDLAPTTTRPSNDVIDGAGATFGLADDGATIALRVGQSARLVLPLDARDPSVSGAAVELIEFVFFDAAAHREFEVRAVAAGRSELVCADPPLQLTFAVEG
jgi:hypothetical protein